MGVLIYGLKYPFSLPIQCCFISLVTSVTMWCNSWLLLWANSDHAIEALDSICFWRLYLIPFKFFPVTGRENLSSLGLFTRFTRWRAGTVDVCSSEAFCESIFLKCLGVSMLWMWWLIEKHVHLVYAWALLQYNALAQEVIVCLWWQM